MQHLMSNLKYIIVSFFILSFAHASPTGKTQQCEEYGVYEDQNGEWISCEPQYESDEGSEEDNQEDGGESDGDNRAENDSEQEIE